MVMVISFIIIFVISRPQSQFISILIFKSYSDSTSITTFVPTSISLSIVIIYLALFTLKLKLFTLVSIIFLSIF